MSKPVLTAEQRAELRSLVRQWGEIVSKRTFGEDGPELEIDFRTMEEIAAVAAEGLIEGTLEQMLAQQAGKLPEEQPCPDCGRVRPTRPCTRVLTTRGAKIQPEERIAHGSACRRDFFPPPDRLGVG